MSSHAESSLSSPPTIAALGAGAGAKGVLERILLAARWALAPIYLGMAVALLGLAFKFLQKLAYSIVRLPGADINDVIIGSLSLVDLSLVANLILMVMLSGYENFVTPLQRTNPGNRPAWLTNVDFSGLKLKLIGSIVAIACVSLLENFLEEPAVSRSEAMLHLGLVLGFALTGVLLALMDRLNPSSHQLD